MRQSRLAAVGAALALATIGWAQLSAARHHGHAGSYSLRVAAVVLAWLVGAFVGALAGRRGAALVALGVIGGVAASFALASGSLSGRALAPPLHYGNADGAFAAAAVAAGALVMVLRVGWPIRVLGGLASVGFLAVCHQTQSAAAEVTAIVTFVVCLAAMASPPIVRKILALAAPMVVVAAIAFTVVVGVSFHPGQHQQSLPVRVAEHGLTERRTALWHDATVIVRAHAVDGVGPGGFATISPTARSDPDARWAHSAWLQQAADQGIVGLVLFTGAIAVGWLTLLRQTSDAVAVAASWALGGLLIQSSIDYVLDFVIVPVTVAALAGAATVTAKRSGISPRHRAGIPAGAGIRG